MSSVLICLTKPFKLLIIKVDIGKGKSLAHIYLNGAFYDHGQIVFIAMFQYKKIFLRFLGTHGTFDPLSCIYK